MSRLDEIRARLAAVAAWGPFDCLAHPGVHHCGVCYPCVAAAVARDALAEVERLTGERAADAQDAARWRSLWACERIRFVGGASLGTPDALASFDFHRKHPARDDAQSRALLLDFVDGTGRGMACFSEVPDASVASEGPAKGAGSSTPRLCAVCWGDGCERCCQTEDFDRAADAIEAGAVAAAPPLRSVWPTWTVWGNQACVLASSASSACTWWRVSGGSLSRALQREHGWFVAYSSEALGIPDGDYFVPGPWARLDPRGVWTSADGRHWESVGRTP